MKRSFNIILTFFISFLVLSSCIGDNIEELIPIDKDKLQGEWFTERYGEKDSTYAFVFRGDSVYVSQYLNKDTTLIVESKYRLAINMMYFYYPDKTEGKAAVSEQTERKMNVSLESKATGVKQTIDMTLYLKENK